MRSPTILLALLPLASLAAQDRAPAPPLISAVRTNLLTQAPRPIYARILIQAPTSCYAPGTPGTPDITVPGFPWIPPIGDSPGTPGTPDVLIPGVPATPGYWYRCD
jgi:hypothetical protein